jgi:HSP20 family protein
VRGVQEIMEEMRKRSFFDYRATGTWMPNINIYQTHNAFIVCLELAGFDPDSLELQLVKPQHVCITGQRQRLDAPELTAPFSIEMMEIDEGAFKRIIDFSEDVDIDAVEARYENGCLWVTLPKKGVE